LSPFFEHAIFWLKRFKIISEMLKLYRKDTQGHFVPPKKKWAAQRRPQFREEFNVFNENLKYDALTCSADISKQLHKCETFLKWIFGSVLVLPEKKKAHQR
jgi:hypothetical protein